MPPLPITFGEFFQCLQKCIPPGGWPNKIAVANSAGPDSACLLFLLAKVVKSNVTAVDREGQIIWRTGLPSEVHSVHVFHNLQEENIRMSAVAKANAWWLDVNHLEIKVPWGKRRFPEKPSHGRPIEEVARNVRYQRLSDGLGLTGSKVLAVAHHADDQVETAVMRMAMGTSDLGLAGMRPVRRWGMGEGDHGNFGAHGGMLRWIIRPLQWFSKDRILATCDAHQIKYVQDPTNFEPFLGIRNYIRYLVREGKAPQRPGEELKENKLPPLAQELQEQFSKVEHSLTLLRSQANALPTNVTLPPDERLREYLRQKGEGRDRLDTRVSNVLAAAIRPSPPSTLLLSIQELAGVQDVSGRVAICRRILRYISPRPWGDLAAEAKGNRAALQNMAAKLWGVHKSKWPRTRLNKLSPFAAFTAPSTVQCWPLYLDKAGRLSLRKSVMPSPRLEQMWLFQRATPHETTLRARQGHANPLEKDITKLFINRRGMGQEEMLYDCRFLITFVKAGMPRQVAHALEDEGTQVLVRSDTEWYWPQVILKTADGSEQMLAKVQYEHESWERWKWPQDEDHTTKDTVYFDTNNWVISDDWIRLRLVRTLEAL